jgi:FHS family glucose/mannose:H+ symporter-like MFS transporter
VPALAFASNFIWVMAIGLLGPSLPAMISGLGISYAQAGFFFTLLSLGSLVGSTVGAAASDRLPRGTLYAACAALYIGGLAGLGFARTYALAALFVLLASLGGSPFSAVGQSIMLGMFPEKRERNLSLMMSIGAVGSLLAPVLVSLNYSAGLVWRWPFLETALLAVAVFVAILVVPIPAAGPPPERHSVLAILGNRHVVGASLMIFFSIGMDLGFSYWLAQYFSAELHVKTAASSSVVGLYLVGIIASRFLIPVGLKRFSVEGYLATSLAFSFVTILLFILVPPAGVKAVLCALYGLGVGPVVPLLLARGSREYPGQSGAVTGVLFAGLSLGGMVFPLLLGVIAARVGIARSYWLSAGIAGGLLAASLLLQRKLTGSGPSDAAP